METKNNKKSISTMPEGVWESSDPAKEKDKSSCSVTTDLQGNGYPTKNKANKPD